MMSSLMALSALFLSLAFAKIGDPPGVPDKDRTYCSHSNTVFALKTAEPEFSCSHFDPAANKPKLIWKTELPFKIEPEKFHPEMERDVQLCIVTGLRLDGKKLVARNCHGYEFHLNPRTGKLLKVIARGR